MNNTRLIRRIKIITICATSFLFVMIGIIAFQYIKMHSLNKTIDNLDAQIAQLQTKQEELESGVSNRSTAIFIEEYARNHLGMLDSDEVYFEYE